MAVWVSEDFPLNLMELLPLLEVLAKGNLLIKRLFEVLVKRKEVFFCFVGLFFMGFVKEKRGVERFPFEDSDSD